MRSTQRQCGQRAEAQTRCLHTLSRLSPGTRPRVGRPPTTLASSPRPISSIVHIRKPHRSSLTVPVGRESGSAHLPWSWGSHSTWQVGKECETYDFWKRLRAPRPPCLQTKVTRQGSASSRCARPAIRNAQTSSARTGAGRRQGANGRLWARLRVSVCFSQGAAAWRDDESALTRASGEAAPL